MSASSAPARPEKWCSLHGEHVVALQLSRPHCLPLHDVGEAAALLRIEVTEAKNVVTLCMHDKNDNEVEQKKVVITGVEASSSQREALIHCSISGGDDDDEEDLLVPLRAVQGEEEGFLGGIHSLLEAVGITYGWFELYFPGQDGQPSLADLKPQTSVEVNNTSSTFFAPFPDQKRNDEEWVMKFDLSKNMDLSVFRGRKQFPVGMFCNQARVIPYSPPSGRTPQRYTPIPFSSWSHSTVLFFPRMVRIVEALDNKDSYWRVPSSEEGAAWAERLGIRVKQGWVRGLEPSAVLKP